MSNDADSEYDNLPIDEAVRRRIDSTKRKRDDVNEETDLVRGMNTPCINSHVSTRNSDNGDNGENTRCVDSS